MRDIERSELKDGEREAMKGELVRGEETRGQEVKRKGQNEWIF